MDPADLLSAARHLASGTGRPRQAFLKRAVSTSYYAMFHCLAKNCADLLIGSTNTRRSEDAWTQVYRALDHGAARSLCNNEQIMAIYPAQIRTFASLFVTMQKKRHDADYDPQCSVIKSTVLTDITTVQTIVTDFSTAPPAARRAFAAAVLLKKR